MSKVTSLILAAGKGSRMKSELPKVLHKVNGVPMVRCCLNALETAGVPTSTVVVGYKEELIREELGERVNYVTQAEQRGTGDAVAAAKSMLAEFDGLVVVVYGDNPLLSPTSVKRLIKAASEEGVAGALLTMKLENTPVAGRVIRDQHGEFVKIIEEQDCSEQEKAITEINVGTYCFRTGPLVKALDMLKPNNNQGEYYLTDVPAHLVSMGHRVNTVEAQDLFETLGVNDLRHLHFAEMASDIRFAESLYPLIDAAIALRKSRGKSHDTEPFLIEPSP